MSLMLSLKDTTWKTKLPKRAYTTISCTLPDEEQPVCGAASQTTFGTSSRSSLFWDELEETPGFACRAAGSSTDDVRGAVIATHSNVAVDNSGSVSDDLQVVTKSAPRRVFGNLRALPASMIAQVNVPETVEVDASQDSDVQDVSPPSPAHVPRPALLGRLQRPNARERTTNRSRSPALVTRRPRPSMIARSDAQLAAALQLEEASVVNAASNSWHGANGINSSDLGRGREWLYVVEPCTRAVRCRGCDERINHREPRVLFQRARQSKVSSVHVRCLSEIEGLIRPVCFDGQPSTEVMMSAQFLPADRSAVEAQLSELPPGPSEGGQSGDIRHFEWPAPVRPRPLAGVRHSDSTVGIGNLQQQLLHTDRDFSADDYEMLLQLDEQHKSSCDNELEVSVLLSQMPVSRIPASGSSRGTQCSICLEQMEVGEEIRTLPCMHFFHRGCIDKWVSMPGTVPKCPIDQEKIGFQSVLL